MRLWKARKGAWRLVNSLIVPIVGPNYLFIVLCSGSWFLVFLSWMTPFAVETADAIRLSFKRRR